MSAVRVIDTPLASKEIFLESTHAASQISGGSDCTWELPQAVVMPPNIVTYVTISRAAIPVSWYNVGKGSQLVLQDDSGTHIISVSSGNYSLTQLLDAIDNALEQISGYPFTDSSENIHTRPLFSWSSITNKVTFSHTLPITLTAETTLSRHLGFTGGVSHTGDPYNPLVSDGCCDVRGLTHIFIQANWITANSGTTLGHVNTLARVPITAPVFETIYYRGYSGGGPIPNYMSVIRLKLCDDLGNSIDMNGMGWSCTLQCDFLYAQPLQIPTALAPAAEAWSHSAKMAFRKKAEEQEKIREVARETQSLRLQKISLLSNFLIDT